MTGGDKQGKGVSNAEQTWMCFSNAKGQGLNPWQGTSCPSLIIGGYGGGFGGLYEGTGHEILYRAWLPDVVVGTDYEDMDMGYMTGDTATDECSWNCSCD